MTPRLVSAIVLAVLIVALTPILAEGGVRRIHVRPGPNAIQRAINRADPGDILLIHQGHYRESPIVTKPLTIRGAGPRRPLIDGDCEALITMDVEANRVTLGRLKVIGGAYFEVNFSSVGRGVARGLRVSDTCGSAEYGVNVFATRKIVLRQNRASGFSDAGLYVGSITTGPVTVRDNLATGNNRGIIIEQVSPNTVVVVGNRANGNDLSGHTADPTGIWLHQSDSVSVIGNVVRNNDGHGIHIDPESSNNRLDDNVGSGNGTYDYFNQGGPTNCGTGNSFVTAQPASPQPCS